MAEPRCRARDSQRPIADPREGGLDCRAMPGKQLTIKSKSEAVYVELRHRILEGGLLPGSSINQELVATELGVSTTPVREALRRLEAEGLVTAFAHREVVVSQLDPAELTSIYEVRECLDALAVSLAAERRTEEDSAAIIEAMQRVATGTDGGNAVDANRRFHAAVYRASHNPVLVELLDTLWDRSDRYRRAVGFIATDEAVRSDHRELAAAVTEGRAEDGAEVMRRHLRRTSETFDAHFRAGAGPDAPD
jgi:DNA-binding GntR family transcriptional regulator